MILTEQRGVVVTSENVAPSQFRIKASRKAFEILSAGLYSDKVRAIIRELSTNAADAHAAVGKSEPFEVHLPNNLEPWFAVTDYGTGLSDEAMNTVYTTYFESDKTDSNDFTGCLGLGSKSPFSYTDSFTVESRFGGMKRVYNAYLSEDGMPSIARLSEEATDEPNGLTVKFPVKSGDFYAFREKAVDVLRWFKTPPKVSGYKMEYPTREYFLKNERFAVSKAREGRSYVVMGNVAYPIDAHDFLTGYDDGTKKLKSLVEWGCELYVGIGDVDISASREKLGYDKKTIRHLRQLLEEALKDLREEVTRDISAKPTLWEARRALHQVRNSFDGFNFTAQWGGKEILSYAKVVKVGEKPSATVERLKVKNRRGSGVVIKKEDAQAIHADGSMIFLNDGRGGYAAVRRWMDGKDWDTKVYLISDYDDAWIAETGIGDVGVKTSTLPKPVRAPGAGRSPVEKTKLYEFVEFGASSSGSFWKPAEVDPDEGGVYVEILYFNYRMEAGEATSHPKALREPLAILRRLGMSVRLYGIRPADKPLLDKSEGDWQNLRQFVEEAIPELEKEYHADYLKVRELERASGYDYRERHPFSDFAEQKFIPTSKFGQFVARIDECARAKERPAVKAYGELRDWAGKHIDDSPDGLLKAREGVYEEYPLLGYIDPYRGGENYIKNVTDYVNMIDEK